jgi:hypothetical protein
MRDGLVSGDRAAKWASSMSRSQIILNAIWVAVIAIAIVFMVYDSRRFEAARQWPSVEGRVVDSGWDSNSSRGQTSSYSARVRYRYRVGDRVYEGHRIWPTAGVSFDTESAARNFVRPWAAGAPVRVYYDPANPADAALVIESMGGPAIFIILIALMLIAGTWYWPRLVAWGRRKSAEAEAKRAQSR